MQQITNVLLMIRPVAYRINEQTAVNNYFQQHLSLSDFVINAKAQKEFDAFVVKLQVKGANNQKYMVMSSAAYYSLIPEQIRSIEKDSTIIHSDLNTIETCGGGSARCMMAEVFLPRG